MSYVAVMPYVHRPWMERAMDTCALDVMLVDNTEYNRGIMRSHNLGIDRMREQDADWLIVMSAAVRFGKPGGLDFLDQLDKYADYGVVSAEPVLGWHLIAFSRETIELAGRWDENFTPYGWDDVDLAIRIHHESDREQRQVPCDVRDAGKSHSLSLGGVTTDNEALMAYFVRKWGAPHGSAWDAYNACPFGDQCNPTGFWPPINGAVWNGPAPREEP